MLKPEVGGFARSGGGINTPHGRIESAWERRGDKVSYTCTIPPNTTAEVALGEVSRMLGSGTYTFYME